MYNRVDVLLPEYGSMVTDLLKNKAKIFLFFFKPVGIFVLHLLPKVFNTIIKKPPTLKVTLKLSHSSEFACKTALAFTRKTISLVAFRVYNFIFFSPLQKSLVLGKH